MEFQIPTEILERDIKFLSGVGPKRAELLKKELNINTFGDLLYYFPYKHIDRTKFYTISQISGDLPYIQFDGRITGVALAGSGRNKRLTAHISDGTGSLELVWFRGLRWISDIVKPGKQFMVYGKPTVFNGKVNLVHPEMEDPDKQDKTINAALQSFYNTSEKLKNNFITSRAIHKLQNKILSALYGKIPETLPGYMLSHLGLAGLNDALLNIHFPQSSVELKKAEYRLKFEELFYLQLSILKQKSERNQKIKGFVFTKVGDLLNNFYHSHLPFELTSAQKRVLREIRKDTGSGKQMNRLLQGDVGSGKTLVAIMSMLIAIDNGFQACLMAPTEILASQHFATITKILEKLPVRTGLLTGSTRKNKRALLHGRLMSGELNILIGTHALIEDTVQFQKLGLVVIDEQHRFGVAQRARMWKKNMTPPHMLVMTATPIPRTLAMTVYGDLEVSVIDELPPGRKAIITAHYFDTKRERLFGFMREQISLGRQIYIVYPLISESEKMDYKDLEDGYLSITRSFPPPDYIVAIVHGKMKQEVKETGMQQFISGRAHILVATTVIEVGVDVPNASVMVIESAERFGLSQLHQLRGRVGRGAEQSYCILMTSHKLSNEARQRIKTITGTNDGFEIAEADLRLRGPGDLEGTMQSGFPFELKISHLGRDNQILEYARQQAMIILDTDPVLAEPGNNILSQQLQKLYPRTEEWGKIS
jgi:ATP-dependent DNA helicase RecG